MQVHRGGNEDIRSDDLPDAGEKVPLRIVQPHYAHGAMDVEEEPVQGQHGFEAIENLLGHGLVGFAGHDAARSGPSA